VGLDHVVLVKVASTAVVAQMLGLTRDEISTRSRSRGWTASRFTYRHSPNTGSRKSWAAGDATSRAVRLALIAKTGEISYPSVLTAKTWGFDVLFKTRSSSSARMAATMEHVLFKIVPRGIHSQTAGSRDEDQRGAPAPGKTAEDIKKITIRTHEACIRIIDKKGPLNNPADRPLHQTWWRPSSSGTSPRRTTRTPSRSTSASTSCATRSPASRTSSSRRLSRPAEAIDRQRAHGGIQGREETGGDRC
jgi:2-methylcitrate dehydratase PrpD